MKMLKNSFCIVIKCLLISTLFIGCYQFLNKVFYNREVFRNPQFHSFPENSLDVLVLGSSHAQYSFQPGIFYADTGLYSFILGSACQPLEVSVEMLKEAYKTQSPKLVILEVFTAMPMKDMCHGDECYVIAQYQMRDEEKYNTISYLPDDKRKLYQNDFLIHHNDWKTMEDLSYFKKENMNYPKKDISGSFGYVLLEPKPIENFWPPNQKSESISVSLRKNDQENLNRIFNLCRIHGSKLLLYKTPIDGLDNENYAYLDAVWEWAKARGVSYIDMISDYEKVNVRMELDVESFHANLKGANLITQYLVNQIQQDGYSFTHQEVEVLDEAYRKNSDGFTRYVLGYETDASVVLNRLKNAFGYCFITYHPTKKSDAQFLEKLQEYLPDLDAKKPYYAIVKDGQVMFSDSQEIKTEIDGTGVILSKDERVIAQQMKTCEGDLCIVYADEKIENLVDYPIQLGPTKAWRLGGQSYRDFIFPKAN